MPALARLFYSVTAGNMDPKVHHDTANRKRRSDNFGEDHDQWHPWGTFGRLLGELVQRDPKEPVIIAEAESTPGIDKRREKEPDFRIDTTPASLRAFNEMFAQ